MWVSMVRTGRGVLAVDFHWSFAGFRVVNTKMTADSLLPTFRQQQFVLCDGILEDIDDPAQQISLLYGSSSGRLLASRLGRPNRGAASEGDPRNLLHCLRCWHS